jgi:hypothetical protein
MNHVEATLHFYRTICHPSHRFAGRLAFLRQLFSDKELQDAIAETDRLDPGWRLEDLEAKRAVIPATENSAEQILAIKSLMPKSWPSPSFAELAKSEEALRGPDEYPSVSTWQAMNELSPEVQLNPNQTRELRGEMERVKRRLAAGH